MIQEENLASHEISAGTIRSSAHFVIFLRNEVNEKLNSKCMHRQMQEQNCFQLPPALTVIFILEVMNGTRRRMENQ